MTQEPYNSADRVFWVVDNGSSHRGQAAIDRLTEQFPNAIMVHTPVHASWLNQIEIFFSIVQRKVVSPNDFTDLDAVVDRLSAFETRYNQTAQPFKWKFTTTDLADLLDQTRPPPTRSPRPSTTPSRLTPDELTSETTKSWGLYREYSGVDELVEHARRHLLATVRDQLNLPQVTEPVAPTAGARPVARVERRERQRVDSKGRVQIERAAYLIIENKGSGDAKRWH